METDKLTEEQVHGRACRGCGSTEPPLHPDEALVTRVTTGVVRDTVTVRCTRCLVVRSNARERYVVEQLEAVGGRSGLYAIRDRATGELVPSTDGKGLELFTMKHSAVHWVTAQISSGASRGR